MFDITVTQDAEGIFTSAEGTGYILSSWIRDKLLGNHFADILSAKLAARISSAVETLNLGAKFAEFGYQHTEAEGKQYFSVKMVKLNDGSFLSVITEVSEQKNSEKKLLANQRLLSFVADSLKTGAWEMDLTTMEVIWTKQILEIYELDERTNLDDAIHFYAPAARPVISQAFSDLVELGRSYDLELPFVTAKGTELWVKVTGEAIYAQDKLVKVYGSMQDITASKLSQD